MPLRTGGVLDWGHDYDGAVLSSSLRGLPILKSRYELATIKDPIRFNPLDIPEIHSALQCVNTEGVDQGDRARLYRSATTDCFNSLPPELLQTILIPMQSKDVRSLKLASRTFANIELTEGFWASRFSKGHEYHHVFEVQRSKPRSWKAMYKSMDLIKPLPAMVNRRRVCVLGLQLRDLLKQMAEPCHGCPLRCYFEPAAEEDYAEWHVASRGLQGPEDLFNRGSRALHIRKVEVPPRTEGLFVSFCWLSSGQFVSGIRFQGANGEEARIGFIHLDREIPLDIPPGIGIRGWHVAHHETGVKAIAALMDNGTLSSWVGEYEGVPKRVLEGESAALSTLRAEFDVSTWRLASLCTESANLCFNPGLEACCIRYPCAVREAIRRIVSSRRRPLESRSTACTLPFYR